MTHTYVVLRVSPAAYNEIREKLEAVGYQHAFLDDDRIDMHGLALQIQPEPEPTPHADARVREKTRAGKPL